MCRPRRPQCRFPDGADRRRVANLGRQLHGSDASLDDAHLREMAGAFSRRRSAYCAKQQGRRIEAQAGEPKHELAEPDLPTAPKFRGLFLGRTGQAPAPVWEVKRNPQNQIIEGQHRRQWP